MATGEELRRVLLEAIEARSGPSLQSNTILGAAAGRLNLPSNDLASQQALLTFFHDLFRIGYLAWGYNLSNPDPPFFKAPTPAGEPPKPIGRDPANPKGYPNNSRPKPAQT